MSLKQHIFDDVSDMRHQVSESFIGSASDVDNNVSVNKKPVSNGGK